MATVPAPPYAALDAPIPARRVVASSDATGVETADQPAPDVQQ